MTLFDLYSCFMTVSHLQKNPLIHLVINDAMVDRNSHEKIGEIKADIKSHFIYIYIYIYSPYQYHLVVLIVQSPLTLSPSISIIHHSWRVF